MKPTTTDYAPRCPRCGRTIADVSDGEPSRIMDVDERNAGWAGVDLCVECAEYLDPTDAFPDAVCVMDWTRCAERSCLRYASDCPCLTEDDAA